MIRRLAIAAFVAHTSFTAAATPAKGSAITSAPTNLNLDRCKRIEH